jgi:hypothetical protein
MNTNNLSFLETYRSVLGDIHGILPSDIDKIEKKFCVKLPHVYKDYLLMFGEKSGNILSSYYTEYPALLENRQDAVFALNFDDRKKTEDKPKLKDSYFFFGQWQGYNFFFFDCEEINDNPTVYVLTDSLLIYKYKDTFIDFLIDEGLKPLLEILNT